MTDVTRFQDDWIKTEMGWKLNMRQQLGPDKVFCRPPTHLAPIGSYLFKY